MEENKNLDLREEELALKEEEIMKRVEELNKKEEKLNKIEAKFVGAKHSIYQHIDVSLGTMDKVVSAVVIVLLAVIIYAVITR